MNVLDDFMILCQIQFLKPNFEFDIKIEFILYLSTIQT